jgi:hypothetical protein
MSHFVSNLYNYIMVEAVEGKAEMISFKLLFYYIFLGSWKCFLDELEKAEDFSELIGTHERFVQKLLDKGLLTQKNERIYVHL